MSELIIYQQWLEACYHAGIPRHINHTCARIMAILLEYGNNEGFTYNQKFLAEKEYIRLRFDLREMGTPDAYFTNLLRKYVDEIQAYQEKRRGEQCGGNPIAPEWAPKLLDERYNMKFIG